MYEIEYRNMSDYKKVFEDNWKHLLDENGNLIEDEVKKELADYSILLDLTSRIYCKLTDNNISNPFVCESVILSEVDSIYEKMYGEEKEDLFNAVLTSLVPYCNNGDLQKSIRAHLVGDKKS